MKSYLNKLTVTCALFFTFQCVGETNPNSSANHFDVMGLTTNMTMSEADSFLKDRGWKMHEEKAFTVNNTSIEFVASRTYWNPDTSKFQDAMEISYSKPPTNPKVIRIFRTYSAYPGSGVQKEYLLLDQMEKNLVGKYGRPHASKRLQAASVLTWSTDNQKKKCASTTSGNFRIIPSTGHSPVPDCHGEHLSITTTFHKKNIGPVVSQIKSELINVDEFRVNDVRFNRYAVEEQTKYERSKINNASSPQL